MIGIRQIVGFLSVVVVTAIFSDTADAQRSAFIDYVTKRAAKERIGKKDNRFRLDLICPVDDDPFARRVFFEYGAIFVTTNDVRVPTTCIFRNREEVERFQGNLEVKAHRFGDWEIELQEAAMERLVEALEDARDLGLRITPLDGKVAGRRSYSDTVKVWNSRFFPALDHWVRRGKIRKVDADETRFAPISVQVARVTDWERQGYFFSTDLSKSIFYSVAPPGTSQHLSLLAFDVVESANPVVRRILNENGWYQTIRSDQPHFTFLGVEESDLASRGLRNIVVNGNSYWVPIAD